MCPSITCMMTDLLDRPTDDTTIFNNRVPSHAGSKTVQRSGPPSPLAEHHPPPNNNSDLICHPGPQQRAARMKQFGILTALTRCQRRLVDFTTASAAEDAPQPRPRLRASNGCPRHGAVKACRMHMLLLLLLPSSVLPTSQRQHLRGGDARPSDFEGRLQMEGCIANGQGWADGHAGITSFTLNEHITATQSPPPPQPGLLGEPTALNASPPLTLHLPFSITPTGSRATRGCVLTQDQGFGSGLKAKGGYDSIANPPPPL